MARGASDARTPCGPCAGQCGLAWPRADQIAKRMFVQHIDEGFQRLAKHAVDRRRALDAARKRRAANALGLDMGRLGDADHVADADLLRRPRELEAPRAPAAPWR